jgi:hypothetical protein
MKPEILVKMKRGVYYPGNHLGKRRDLEELVTQGLLERMDGSFFCGSDNQPSYCLSDEGCREKRKNSI